MRIALDAMGGDHAPAATVEGALLAVRQQGVEVALVGREDALRAELARHGSAPPGVTVVHASEVIEMDEHPAQAARTKRDSSMIVGMRLVKRGEAQAFVSAGNTGGAMAAALLALGRLRGVERPAIGALLPKLAGGVTLLLDAGANAECRPSHLVQFAHMGVAYLERALAVNNPSVGLLNIGEEATKGSPLAQEAHALLAASSLNFFGNVEGRDLTRGVVDVIVTDGFTGNVVLKTAEGVLEMFGRELKSALTSRPYYLPAALMLRPALNGLAKKFDYSEYGGAPLLGTNGVVVIAHGRSDAKAIASSIRVAAEGARSGMQDALRDVFARSPGVDADEPMAEEAPVEAERPTR